MNFGVPKAYSQTIFYDFLRNAGDAKTQLRQMVRYGMHESKFRKNRGGVDVQLGSGEVWFPFLSFDDERGQMTMSYLTFCFPEVLHKVTVGEEDYRKDQARSHGAIWFQSHEVSCWINWCLVLGKHLVPLATALPLAIMGLPLDSPWILPKSGGSPMDGPQVSQHFVRTWNSEMHPWASLWREAWW